MKRGLLLVIVCVAAATPAYAQGQDDPVAKAAFRFGAVGLTPRASLENLGVDNNVFNDPTSASPKSDFTLTLQGKVDAWMHVRRALLNGTATDDVVYYKKYANQRYSNRNYKFGIELPFTRFSFRGNTRYIKAKDRPGFEIDARLLHTETDFDGAVEWRASAKSFLGVSGARQRISFDAAAVFAGADVRAELSRVGTQENITFRHELTPLTTITVDIGKQHDRFDFNPLRDSDSTRFVLGAKFNQFALLKGGATFGYRSFHPLVSGLSDYNGAIFSADLTYVARGATKLALLADRDINYSYDINQPYFLQTGATLSLSRQVYRSFDVVGSAGVHHLSYRDRLGAVVVAADRTDVVHSYRIGAGYRLGRSLRLGLNLDKQHRTSVLSARTYDNLKFGAAVTYEF